MIGSPYEITPQLISVPWIDCMNTTKIQDHKKENNNAYTFVLTNYNPLIKPKGNYRLFLDVSVHTSMYAFIK